MAEDAVSLGKRKRREVDEERAAGSTLFVSNLPYSATSTDLQTLFSDLAPVRSAFIVLEENVSKGVGYVSFAIKEDAATAMETIERDGIELNGWKLRVQMADRKPNEKTVEKKVKSDRKTPSVPRVSHLKIMKDPNAIRTIIISGLPSSVDQKMLWKKVRKCDGAESAELVEGEAGVAHVLFSSPAAASHAVEKLHAHVFKGAILSVTLKKRLETLAKVPAKKDGASSSVAPSRASRLIVRNVPWNITEKDLRALFLPFGPVYSITIPTEKLSSDELKAKNAKPRARGFAFVWFFSKKDAERAIAGVNGRSVVAGAVIAPTMNKKERARLRRQLREKERVEDGEEAGAGAGEDEKSEDGSQDEEKAEPETSELRNSGARILAVDWALSKERWEEAKAKTLADQGEESVESGEGSDPESAAEEGSDEESENSADSGEETDVDEGDNVRSDAENAGKPTLPQTDVGTTLFLRNVPFDATEDELRILFRAFGPLRYALITMDAETGRSRGTGFVCFWNKEDADKAIRQSELLSRETGTLAPKKNPFSLPSLLTPDPSSSLAQSLVLHGRTLDVTRAVTRDTAAQLKDEGERQREKADKRNLYLLREGVIFPGTPAEATLSTAELEKRNASFNARRAMLKSNPALYVSKTRLSIRQLPLFVSDLAVKRLGIHAVRAFEEEVKRGERQPLSVDELRADDEVDVEKSQQKKGTWKKGERETGVKQAKVVRQSDHVDALTGKGKSRSYGFLEMNRHSDALRVLRWTNNNQTLGPLLEDWWKSEIEELIKTLEKSKPKSGDEEGEDVEARVRRLKGELERLKSGEGRKGRKALIVEFSIENAQVVNRRKDKIELMKSASRRPRSKSDANGDGDGEPADSKLPKRRKVEKSVAVKDGPTLGAKADGGSDEVSRPKNALGSMIGRKRKMRKTKGKT